MIRRTALRLLPLLLLGCGTTLQPRDLGPDPAQLGLPPMAVHRLPNGLRVVTIEDHAHPIVGLAAYVTTGGRTESAPYAGSLHFIEHLVFKGGTRRFAPAAFRRRMVELGDESGGWTWDDEINFGFEVPKDNFAEALDVFAESLLELRWSDGWFEDERKVVLQEIEKVSERPWHQLWNRWEAEAFPKHPYGRAVIGTPETVRGQTRAQLERYYHERFVPNHLVLAVAGDFDTATLLAAIRSRMDRYRPGPPSFELGIREAEPTAPRRTRLARPGATTARFIVGFRTPGAAHPDTAGLLLLAEILRSPTHGLVAWLQRKAQWVTTLEVSHNFMVDYGAFTVSGELPASKVATVVPWLEQYLTHLADHPPPPEVVRQAARSVLASRARSWESMGAKAREIGFWLERMGEPALRRTTKRILAHRPESLAALARRRLTPARWVEAVMLPTGADPGVTQVIAAPDPAPAVPVLDRPGLLMPLAGAPWRVMSREDRGRLHRFRFDSGLQLLVRVVPRTPLVQVVTWVAGGQWVEPADKAGLGVLTSRLSATASRHLGVAQWDRLLSAAAVAAASEHTFESRSNIARNVHHRDGSTLSFSGTKSQWAMLLALTGEAALRGRFVDGEVEKQKRVLLSEIDSLVEDNLEYAKQEFYRLAFPDHPYGRPTIGDRATVERLSPDDVRDHYARTWTPDRMTVAVSGDLDPEEVVRFVATRWSDGHGRAGPLPPIRTPSERAQRTRVLKRGKAQWVIDWGLPTLRVSDPRLPTLEILMGITRGRHFYKYVYQRGVSYRSWIKLWPHRGPSAWILENDVARKGYEATLDEMMADLRRYARERYTQAEVALARVRLLNRATLDAQNGLLSAFQTAWAVANGLGLDYWTRWTRAIEAVTPEAVTALAREVIRPDALYRLELR